MIEETTKLGREIRKSFEGLIDKKDDKWKVNNKRSAEDWKMVKKMIRRTSKKNRTMTRIIRKCCQKMKTKQKRKF